MGAIVAAFVCGLIFGLGLVIGQMSNPAKVLNFLDFFGTWDPSLAFVMGGAVAVAAIGFALARRRRTPLLADAFDLPQKTRIDARLLSGAAFFGVGWGLVGFCPGPALTALSFGRGEAFLFVAAMIAGMVIFNRLDGIYQRGAQKDAATADARSS
jgi:uncharacterized membrane protein YedE/YeeE